MKQDLYHTVTHHILDAMEQGAKEYEMPWHRVTGVPMNVSTGNRYQGVNILSLLCASLKKGYTSKHWGTFHQWKEIGAVVRKGEKASPVVFYKPMEREQANPETGEFERVKTYVARLSWVFNADQVDGWNAPTPTILGTAEIIQRAEVFVASTGAKIISQGESAFYSPAKDFISMPDRERFIATSTSTATENYYSVLFHELIHWTGHEQRISRDLSKRFNDEHRAMEELVAELGAAFLCAQQEISPTPRKDHAAYLSSWLTVFQNDNRAVFHAASKASQAVEYLNSLQPENLRTAA